MQKLRRLQRKRETKLERLIGKLNRDKLVTGYEHERTPLQVPEDNLPEETFGDLEPPTKSEEDTAHWNRLEEDLIGRNEERDIEGEDSA